MPPKITPKGDSVESTRPSNSHGNRPHPPPSPTESVDSNTSAATWESDISLFPCVRSSEVPSTPSTEIMPSFTGDPKEAKTGLDDKSPAAATGGIGGWFTGVSAPVTVGIPTKVAGGASDEITTTLEGRPQSFKMKRSTTSSSSNMPPSGKPTKSTTPQNITASTPSGRFAFFTRSAPTTPKLPDTPEDEFLNLDITAALFPNGPADPFSPSSFKNLLTNAENLLRKLQKAYKVRTQAVHELTREKEAQADELEEAETRAAHLKTQLDDLKEKLKQQDEDILAIANELANERQSRAEEKEANEQALLQHLKVQAEPSEGRNRSLVSRGSRSSFESYNLEDTDSLFSRPARSHTSTSSAGTGITTPEIMALDSDKSSIGSRTPRGNTTISQRPMTNTKMPPPPLPTKSVFSKLLGGGGNTSAPMISHPPQSENNLGISDTGCANCKGGSTTVAWDAVGLLRAENKELKDRVGLLEDGVDGALSLVLCRSWKG